MRTTHSLRAVCTCPVDGTQDHYDVTVETRRAEAIPVEDILGVVRELGQGEAIYQEEFTERLWNRLPDPVKVTTVGVHSGVTTICEVGNAEPIKRGAGAPAG